MHDVSQSVVGVNTLCAGSQIQDNSNKCLLPVQLGVSRTWAFILEAVLGLKKDEQPNHCSSCCRSYGALRMTTDLSKLAGLLVPTHRLFYARSGRKYITHF